MRDFIQKSSDDKFQSLAVYAVSCGNRGIIDLLDISDLARNYNGQSLLEVALQHKKIETFFDLIDKVPRFKNFGIQSRELQKVAILAATTGQSPVLWYLFKRGFSPLYVLQNTNILGHAIIAGQFKCADWILSEFGGNQLLGMITIGPVPIHDHAILSNSLETLKFLLQRGLSPNFHLINGQSALNYAIIVGNVPLLKLLLRFRPDPFRIDGLGMSAASLANLSSSLIIAEIMASYTHSFK